MRERERLLAQRAARHLSSSGRRAHGVGDWPAGVGLLTRAAALLPAEDGLRLEVLPDLGYALSDVDDFDRAARAFEEAIARAPVLGERRIDANARLGRLWIGLMTRPDADLARRPTRSAP
jgi:hypothetical protein